MTYQGSEGLRGVQGGVRGHQGVLGATRLLPTPKWVIKQQNNGSKSWFKVPKVCPWPKRDGIYSFMMHLWPFGCITTALYSENANLWIPVISWHFTLLVSTDQTIEFLDGFLIFLIFWTKMKWDTFLKWWYCSFLVFPFLCYSAVSYPMYFQFDLTVQLSYDNISTRNLFQLKANPHLSGVKIHGNFVLL